MTKALQEWPDYCEAFPYCHSDTLRPGCGPGRLLHPGGSDKAVVLVHGLVESPYLMKDLASYFFHELGYDVYLPLLHGHGLRDPQGMMGVSLDEWKANVSFALKSASAVSQKVSLGGFSTGGALGFHFAATDPLVTGDLYLFAAAFALYGGPGNALSFLAEYFLLSPIVDSITPEDHLIGDNPYRYSTVPYISARELVVLMRENNVLLKNYGRDSSFEKRIFSAWSEADTVISVDAIRDLEKIVDVTRYSFYEIAEDLEVIHTSIMLEEPVYAPGATESSPPLTPANPRFADMMAALDRFERSA